MDWRDKAACRTENPELFFAGDGGIDSRQVKVAKRICRRCVVCGECLAWALKVRQPYGIWGGKSETERRVLLLATEDQNNV
ncbi:WhiB family transcriptional regulator [Kribbella sindirgiensis]|uniref:Transcriptional regulator WhiB n=1 Tax=Kribbella sindirgiensis TaxID=1124744 RepID=A0A4V2M4A7_9ACTN|nr:WhiB family transcriptional regulator [Kribbella sindirgiensis]TCC35212.1 WhiB family transcriptional regulator [Kribbella sindirgiensis]